MEGQLLHRYPHSNPHIPDMNKSTLWLATGALVASIVFIGYSANRAVPKSPDTSARATNDNGEDFRSKTEVHLTHIDGATEPPEKARESFRGIASFYGVSTNGTRTASGVPLDDSASTAAHRTLPFGTRVRVTNLSNGLKEIVEITDRGPYAKGRIIDVSRNAAEKLDMIQAGIVSVEVEVLSVVAATEQPSLADD